MSKMPRVLLGDVLRALDHRERLVGDGDRLLAGGGVDLARPRSPGSTSSSRASSRFISANTASAALAALASSSVQKKTVIDRAHRLARVDELGGSRPVRGRGASSSRATHERGARPRERMRSSRPSRTTRRTIRSAADARARRRTATTEIASVPWVSCWMPFHMPKHAGIGAERGDHAARDRAVGEPLDRGDHEAERDQAERDERGRLASQAPGSPCAER